MGELYRATFPEGSKVRVVSRSALDTFARNWKYHHELRPEQLDYAGVTATATGILNPNIE